MPNSTIITSWRPNRCAHCHLMPYWYSSVINEAKNKGYNVIDLFADQANRADFEKSMNQDDPIFFGGIGHGNPSVFTGQDGLDAIIACTNDQLLSGRITTLISCLTAQKLGPSIAKKGGLAYLGYFPSFVFEYDNSKPVEQDVLLQPFIDFSTLTAKLLLAGETAKSAYDKTIARCDYLINLWRTNPPIPALAGTIIQKVIKDRDGLRLFGDPNARIPLVTSEMIYEALFGRMI